LFKVYLGKTIAIDADISLDNMYLAFAEINTSGTAIQSTIKIVSIQKNEIINTFSAESGSLVTDIKYQDGNRLICMYDDSIHEIKNEQDEEIVKLSEDGNKITFGGINLTNYTFRILENSSLLNTESSVEITNVASKKTSTYTLKGATKEVNSYNSIIAINLGSEVHFISTNGWLLKKYTSNQEINKIVLNNNFAGIVYRSKIEIVDF
jgi:hypothetical protein